MIAFMASVLKQVLWLTDIFVGGNFWLLQDTYPLSVALLPARMDNYSWWADLGRTSLSVSAAIGWSCGK